MIRISSLFILLLMSYIGTSQKVLISNISTGEPVPHAVCSSTDSKEILLSDDLGQVDLDVFKNSNHIIIRAMGYLSVHKSYSTIEEQNFQITLMPISFTMDEVIVSATRWEQRLKDIPQSLELIKAENRQLHQPQTTADLLGMASNTFIQKSQQGGGSPMIRGFSTNRLLYSFDGVRMNTAIYRSGNLHNVISIDPFALRSAEVVLGPGSVIYGSDAIGAVMSFQSLSPQLSAEAESRIFGNADFRYNSANQEATVHADYNVGWNALSFLGSVSSSKFGDLRMGTNGPDDYLQKTYIQTIDGIDKIIINEDPLVQKPSGYSQINLMQKIRWKPNSNTELNYGFHHSETSEFSRYDRMRSTRAGIPRYGKWNYGPQIWTMNHLVLHHQKTRGLYTKMSLSLASQLFEESRISRNFNSPIEQNRTEKVKAWSANLDLIKQLNAKNTILYGFEYVLNNVESKGKENNIQTNVSLEGPSRYPQADWESIGLYLASEHQWNAKLSSQFGIRYNHFSLNALFDTRFYPFPFSKVETNHSAISGNMGLILRPDKTWVASLNLASAFRAPNVDDLGKVFESQPGEVVIPNPDLRSEFAYHAELGLSKTISKILIIKTAFYYTYLDDAMVRRNDQLNGSDSIVYDGSLSQVQSIQNAAFANVYGFQLGFEYKLSSGLGFTSSFNYQKGEEELDNEEKSPSRHAAPYFGNTSLSFERNKIKLLLSYVYSGSKTHEQLPDEEKTKIEIYPLNTSGLTFSPSWYTLNFKLNYKYSEYLGFSAGLENITNQRYRTYSSGQTAAGRSVFLSLNLGF